MKKRKTGLAVLAVVCVCSLLFMIFALFYSGRENGYTPPAFDRNAQSGTPTAGEDLGWSLVYQSGMNFSAHVCGKIIVTNKKADVYFTNDKGNDVWIKLRILDENEKILAETGLLKPGEYISSVRFTSLPQSGAKIKLKIMAYEPNTYYSAGSATLNTVLTIGG